MIFGKLQFFFGILFSFYLSVYSSIIGHPPSADTIFSDISSENAEYKLFTSTNMLELLVDHSKSFSLILNSTLTAFEMEMRNEQLLTRFYCENDETDSFDWNLKDHNCKVLTVKPSYDFIFNLAKNNGTMLKNVTIETLKPGKQQLIVHARLANVSNEDKIFVDTMKAYITVNVGRSDTILIISSIIGWIYFVAWSVSFYPQLYDNFRRKSVIGLNFDFVALNITGFICYSVFNLSLYFNETVQKQYEILHPRSQIPVQINDVIFAIHATFATLICIVQCFLFERANQQISLPTKLFLGIVFVACAIVGIMVIATDLCTTLSYLYLFSYIKLTITIIKYIPQAWFNYQRKSTIGWSIGNIFLDFTGGSLSICQMFLLAHNYDDWLAIFNNFTKFGLGFISIMFDILFILQHYVFYSHCASVHDSQASFLVNNMNENGCNSGIVAKEILNPTDRLYNPDNKLYPPYTIEKI